MQNIAMSGTKRLFLVFLISVAVGSYFWVRYLRKRTQIVQGAVIMRNSDPRKQLPIANVEVTANDGLSVVTAKSDASGLFRAKLRKPLLHGRVVTLRFRHPDYEPLNMIANTSGTITVASLTPVTRPKVVNDNVP